MPFRTTNWSNWGIDFIVVVGDRVVLQRKGVNLRIARPIGRRKIEIPQIRNRVDHAEPRPHDPSEYGIAVGRGAARLQGRGVVLVVEKPAALGRIGPSQSGHRQGSHRIGPRILQIHRWHVSSRNVVTVDVEGAPLDEAHHACGLLRTAMDERVGVDTAARSSARSW